MTVLRRTVRRFDAGTASKTRRLVNGWLKAEGTVARTGVQEYRRADGGVIRELRLPEEVFRAETMDGLAMAPITDEHPPEMLDSTNTAAYSRGHLGERIEVVDGRLVKASLLVTDADLVDRIERGEQVELSVGYFCDLEEGAGEWNGERYDCVQRNIVPNHVAFTKRARGGPELRVRLDGEAIWPGERDTNAITRTMSEAYERARAMADVNRALMVRELEQRWKNEKR